MFRWSTSTHLPPVGHRRGGERAKTNSASRSRATPNTQLQLKEASAWRAEWRRGCVARRLCACWSKMGRPRCLRMRFSVGKPGCYRASHRLEAPLLAYSEDYAEQPPPAPCLRTARTMLSNHHQHLVRSACLLPRSCAMKAGYFPPCHAAASQEDGSTIETPTSRTRSPPFTRAASTRPLRWVHARHQICRQSTEDQTRGALINAVDTPIRAPPYRPRRR
jgi:hypothetical protein